MCTRPLKAYQNLKGGRPLFGSSAETDPDAGSELKLPCGKCPECCKTYYTQWTTRGTREISQWDTSLFITLTYDEKNLPPDRSLKKKDVQKFIKRIKKYFKSTKENPIRQIYCGEYGTRTLRPHYHVILFNCDFSDKKNHYKSPAGHQVYTSQTLSKLWGLGIAEFGYAEPASIAYLFKYILKKKSRKEKLKPLIIEKDGLTWTVDHEFIEASRNPGIGASYRGTKTLRNGFITVDGQKKPIPKYYLEHLRKTDPETYDHLLNMKFDFMSKKEKLSEKRLQTIEKCQKKWTDTRKKL